MPKKLLILSCLVLSATLYSQEPRLVLPTGHSGAVFSAQFSNDGRLLLTQATDNTPRLWDVFTGKLLNSYTGHIAGINTATFSSDNQRILTASNDSTARVWETASGKCIAILKGHAGKVSCAFFANMGKAVVTGSPDKTIRVWDAINGKELSKILTRQHIYSMVVSPGGNFVILSASYSMEVWSTSTRKMVAELKNDDFSGAAFSSDEKFVLTTPENGKAKIWSTKHWKPLFDLPGENGSIGRGLFSVDNKHVFIPYGRMNTMIKMYEVATGKLVQTFTGHKSDVHFMSQTKNGDLLSTTSLDSTVKVWNIKTGKVLHSIKRYYPAYFAEIDPANKYLAIDNNRSISMYDLRNGKLVHELAERSNVSEAVKYSTDGKQIGTISADSTLKVYDAATGKLSFILAGHRDLITDFAFSPNGKFIATSSRDLTAKIWDATTGKLLHPWLIHRATGRRGGAVNSIEYSSDGKLLLTSSNDGYARVWDADSAFLLLELTGHRDFVVNASFSPDDRYIATSSLDSTVMVWDYKNRKFMYEIPVASNYIFRKSFASFSHDSKKILVFQNSGTLAAVYNVSDAKWLYKLEHPGGQVLSARFSNNGKYIVTTTWWTNTAYVWDAADGKLLYTLQGHNDEVKDAMFTPDDQRLVTFSADNTAKVWNVANGKLIFDLKGHKDEVVAATYNPAASRLITTSKDDINKVWDMQTGKELYAFVSIDSADYLLQEPNGYYMATPDAVKLLHYVTNDLNVVTFQQLDIKLNRPHKLLTAIGSTDTALMSSYKKAWQKRMKKIGIDTLAFSKGYSVPEADFGNRSVIGYEQTSGKLKLNIKASDRSFRLDKMNIWINEVPLFGIKGLSLAHKNSRQFDTVVTVTLSKGENIIETAVSNIAGAESYRMPLQVKYGTEDSKTAKLYFIGIGINEFEQSSHNLQWSVKDIRDLAAKLKSRYGSNYVVDTLFDRQVTRQNILALKKKIQTFGVDDKIIISYSGHGLLSKELDYYLSTYNIDFEKPEANGLSYDELESLLDNISARKKLLLIDACHSGEVDKEEIERIQTAKKVLDTSGVSTRSTIKVSGKTGVGMKNSFELMKDIFVNVGKSTGATIVSAAGGMQYAQERGDLKNGVFTYCIIDAFNNNTTLTVSQLKKIVSTRVAQITNGLQKPTSRNETNLYDWIIW